MKYLKNFMGIFLSIMMVISLIPSGLFEAIVVKADAKVYICEIAMSSDKNESTAKSGLVGYDIIDNDINEGAGAGSNYIYIGYKTTTDVTKAITSVVASNSNIAPDGYSMIAIKQGNGDFNEGAGGDYVYLYYKKDGKSNVGLSSLEVSSSSGEGSVKNIEKNTVQNFNEEGKTRYINLGFSVHEHVWDELVEEKTPTCKEDGYRVYKCSECSKQKKETLNAIDHDWDDGTIVEEATEDKNGTIIYTCNKCKKIQKIYFDVNGDIVKNVPEPTKPNQNFSDSVYKNGLGFNTSLSVEGNQNRNPLTAAEGASGNLTRISELLVSKRTNASSGIEYNYFNKDKNNASDGSGLNMGFVDGNVFCSNHSLLNSWQLDSQSTNLSNVENNYVNSRMVALDIDGDGYDDTIAESSLLADTKSANLHFIDAKSGKKYGYSENYTIKSNGIRQRYTGAFVVLTAGDMDGDGKDELAIYKPSEEYTIVSGELGYNNSKVVIYDVEMSEGDIKLTELASEIIDKGYKLLANKSLPQIVDLDVADLDGDGKEELVAVSSLNQVQSEIVSVANTGSYIGVYAIVDNKFEKKYSRRLAFTGAEYGITDNATVQSRVMASLSFAGVTVGDMNGDGYKEIVVGGYSTFKDGYILANKYGVVQIGYDISKGKYAELYGGLPHTISAIDYIGRRNTSLKKDMIWEPMAIKAYAGKGKEYANVLFIEGETYLFGEGRPDDNTFTTYFNGGVESEHVMSLSGSEILANAAKYRYVKDGGVINIRQNGNYLYYAGVSEVIAGNFNGNTFGQEQIIAIVYYGKIKDDSVIDSTAIINDTTAVYECDMVGLSRTTVGNDEGRYTELHTENVSGSNSFDSYTAICEIDYDNDGTIVEYAGSDYYFSDPNVVAILQASPYYSDLESLDDNYSTNGGTTFGKAKATGSSKNTEFSVSAGAIVGFEQDFSLLGMADIAGVEFNLETSVNASYEEEISKEIEYGTSYSASPLNNSVVLSMTPYKRYKYWMYIPKYTLPTQEEATKMAEQRDKAYENYYKYFSEGDVESAKREYNKYLKYYDTIKTLESLIGKEQEITYRTENNTVATMTIKPEYGKVIEGYWTPYYICIPNQPRMSLITTEKYDKVAKEEGLEVIEGNILKNEPGDPYTYESQSSGYSNFDGGQVIQSHASADGFVNVGFGAGNTITQSINTEESKTTTYGYGTSVATETKFKLAGAVAGFTTSIDTSKGLSYTDTSSTSFEGTVAASPSEKYGFEWRFGKWDTIINGNACIVLGYLVKNRVSPAPLPKNITAVDTSQSTVTISWEAPSRMEEVDGYVIDMVQDDCSKKNITDKIPADATSYVIDDLAPGTAYTFELRTVSKGETDLEALKCEYSNPINCRTKYKAGENAPSINTEPKNQMVLANGEAYLTVEAKRIQESTKPITYQWQYRKSADEIFVNVEDESATTNTLKISSVSMEKSGYEYRCLISQDYQSITRTIVSSVVTVKASESQEEVDAFNKQMSEEETTKKEEETTKKEEETTKKEEETTKKEEETTKKEEETTKKEEETTKKEEEITKKEEETTKKEEETTKKEEETTVSKTKITLNKKSASIIVTGKVQLKATVKAYGKKVKVTWKSSNKKIASVSSNGLVKGVGAGTATITAKTSDGKTAKCKITVKRAPSKVSLNKKNVILFEKETCTLKAKIPAKTYTTFKFTTSNKKVATVNSKGKVVAKKPGTATITVKTANGKTAKCKITVIDFYDYYY